MMDNEWIMGDGHETVELQQFIRQMGNLQHGFMDWSSLVFLLWILDSFRIEHTKNQGLLDPFIWGNKNAIRGWYWISIFGVWD